MAGQRYIVSGAVAVIGTHDGSERYLYRGAVIERSAFKAASIDHLLGVGLLTELAEEEPAPPAPTAEEQAAAAKAATTGPAKAESK